MGPVVVVDPMVKAITILGIALLVVSLIFLLRDSIRRPANSVGMVIWVVLMTVGIVIALAGGYQWQYQATREPTPAEADAWIKKAEAELKKRQESLKAAVDNAKEVNEKVIREYEAEQRAKGGR